MPTCMNDIMLVCTINVTQTHTPCSIKTTHYKVRYFVKDKTRIRSQIAQSQLISLILVVLSLVDCNNFKL